MKSGTILWLLASVTLFAGSAAAGDAVLICHGDDCEVVRPGGTSSGGGFTKAGPPASTTNTVERRPIYVYPSVGYRRHVSGHVHHHHHGCGHHYRPSYPYVYGRHYSYPRTYRYGRVHRDGYGRQPARRHSYRGIRHRRGSSAGRRYRN
ncbi:MAG: hypothetical protein GY937_09700 [bacterium]|nr:hypothetical protein [bacterium]